MTMDDWSWEEDCKLDHVQDISLLLFILNMQMDTVVPYPKDVLLPSLKSETKIHLAL